MIEYLGWDSDFFQKKIGKVDITDESINLSRDIEVAYNEGYSLLYAFGACEIDLNEYKSVVREANLVDKKVIYKIDLQDKQFESNYLRDVTCDEVSADFENLAYESGKYSRFYLDKNFESHDFRRLYYSWIQKSLSKQIADRVFIIEDNEHVVGMVTLKIAETAQIGLIAVSAGMQGKGYGKLLINECLAEAVKHHCSYLIVPTQYDNRQACNFYEKCGFSIQSITNVYHFWL